MSNLVDLFRFFESTHQTALSKYRGTAWHVLVKERGKFSPQYQTDNSVVGYEIVDKITGRHLADTYVDTKSAGVFTLDTTHMNENSIHVLKQHSTHQSFTSAHEAASFVWENNTKGAHQVFRHLMSWIVAVIDWIVALAKGLLKVLLALVSVWALITALVSIDQESLLIQRIVGSVMSFVVDEGVREPPS